MLVKMLLSLFVIISLFFSGIQSMSFVNNMTLSSDALSELFFSEIRNNQKLHEISAHDSKQYNARKCILSLRALVTQFPSLNVIPFFDSWGKFPSGILQGNLYDVGNFDECVKASVTLSKLTGVISGQYCFAAIPLIKDKSLKYPSLDTPTMEGRDGLADVLKLHIGICVPDTCSPELLTQIFDISASSSFNGALKGITVSLCTNGKKPEYQAIDIIGITVFSIFAALMIGSSTYDFFITYFNKTPITVLLAFSIFTNGKKLFAINLKKNSNQITCLIGIRVFSMVWVIFAHTYSFTPMVPLINTRDVFKWLKAPLSQHVINATISVDSFFFISGVLVAWLGLKELDRTKGKLNVIMMYVHRYIRLTPPVAAGLLFMFSLNKFIGTGPFRQTLMNMNECDGYNWWPVLLYLQNYLYESHCYPQTWYLAIDFQLYILSPLILIPMWKWGKKFAPILVVLALLSIGCVMGTFFAEGFTDLKGMWNNGEWQKTYIPTHTRYSPWLVGFGLGYFMHINRHKTFRLSKILQLLGWTISFITIVSIVYAPYFTESTGTGTVFEAAMYESLKRCSWAIALAWITFACHFGFGGVVDTFLSHPFWQPLGRLTYSLYLVHLFVFAINFGIKRTEYYFSDYNQILTFWSTFGMSLMVAIGMTLGFEFPILTLEKTIFGRWETDQKTRVEATASPQNVIVEVPNKDV